MSAELSFEVKDDAFEVGFVEDLLTFGGTEEESATAEIVDLASDALGMIVNAGQETVTEDRGLACSDE